MYCDINCTLLGLKSFPVSGCRVLGVEKKKGKKERKKDRMKEESFLSM